MVFTRLNFHRYHYRITDIRPEIVTIAVTIGRGERVTLPLRVHVMSDGRSWQVVKQVAVDCPRVTRQL